jgi:tryptophan 2,3-dioxygenase
MDKKLFFDMMQQEGVSDYEVYLKTSELFSCQIPFNDLCNGDELQFQIVHQVEELLMKLLNYTLLDINEYMVAHQTNKVITLFQRVRMSQLTMLQLLDFLGTMSPKEYQEVRKKLGRGSGRDSPGFKAIIKIVPHLWETYKINYLEKEDLTLEQVYDLNFNHTDAYVVAECLLDFEVLFQRFLAQHMQVVNRSIGSEAKSLNGNDIEKLKKSMTMKFFPELWRIRSDMTDRWGQEYGYIRDHIK